MLDLDTRTAILRLAAQGHGKRKIARALGVSKNSVKRVLAEGQPEVPKLQRAERLDEHLELVRQLSTHCRGNLVRVCEELAAKGVEVGYPTLTSFCRRHGIGTKKKQRAGRYHFGPGAEMQHDTSPHDVVVGGRLRHLQCASLVLCYCRKQYAQLYPRWSRFECRVFLSEAIQWLGGAAADCMLDNSSVIIAHGTGKDAVPAPAMKALADRFGFTLVAHRIGDANRSARVERPFYHIETNFYAGRHFEDLADLNRQLVEWCDKKNSRFHRGVRAIPTELFVAELPELKALPLHIPEVYDLHRRRVDVEGYVNLHTNRYSVDDDLIGLNVEVREAIDKIRVFQGHRLVEVHDKREHGAHQRVSLDKHKADGRWRRSPPPPSPEEGLLRGQGPELAALIDALQKRHGGRAVRAVRRLHQLWNDYPIEALRGAVSSALEYGLIDLSRIETMVLRRIAGDFFRLSIDQQEDDHG